MEERSPGPPRVAKARKSIVEAIRGKYVLQITSVPVRWEYSKEP